MATNILIFAPFLERERSKMEGLLLALINKVKEIAQKLGLISDYVVEQGTSGIWTYRKWNSGIAECWGVFTLNTTFTRSRDYYGYSMPANKSIGLPFTFASQPIASIEYNPPNVGSVLFCLTSETTVIFDLANSKQQTTAYDVPVLLAVHGTWK